MAGEKGIGVTARPREFFSLPYDMAVVRPLRQTTRAEREAALREAAYNTELLRQDMIYVDLKTDSGLSAWSVTHAASLLGGETLEAGVELAVEGSAAFGALSRRFSEYFGFPFVVPCTQGRAAERLWARLHVREGSVVPGNMLFPSTRYHIESNGGKVIDVIRQSAYDPYAEDAFKGNLDLDKLRAVFEEHGKEKIPCVYVELCVNACGGHPVSLENLKQLRSFLQPLGVPLFLDASRIVENSYLVQTREAAYHERSIAEIMRETCSYADACTLSAQKDFLVRDGGFIGTRDEKSYQRAYFQTFLDGAQPSVPTLERLALSLHEVCRSDAYVASRGEQVRYLFAKLVANKLPVLRPSGGHGVFLDINRFLPHVPAANFPAEALAAHVFVLSGIRLTKGPPPTEAQNARGISLLRLAIPSRRYLPAHMDDVAQVLAYAYSQKAHILGLKRVEQPGRSRYAPAYFSPMEEQAWL
jgi:tyrosine phenol-lyase